MDQPAFVWSGGAVAAVAGHARHSAAELAVGRGAACLRRRGECVKSARAARLVRRAQSEFSAASVLGEQYLRAMREKAASEAEKRAGTAAEVAAAASERDHEEETLGLLEWSLICSHVARFANTDAAKRYIRAGLPMSDTQQNAELLMRETHDLMELEGKWGKSVSSLKGCAEQFGMLIDRAKKGGMLEGTELVAIAQTLGIARKLRRVILDIHEGVLDDDEGAEPESSAQIADRLAGISSRTASAFSAGKATNEAHGASADPAGALPVLYSILNELDCHAEKETLIYKSIDDYGTVRDSASVKLHEVRRQQNSVSASIKSALDEIIFKKSECLQDRIITQRYDRFVIPVKAGSKSAIRGTVHDASSSGATLFIEPREIEPLNTRLKVLARKERELVEQVLIELSAKLGEADIAADLRAIDAALFRIDVAAARARYSAYMGGVEPIFSSAPTGVDAAVAQGADAPVYSVDLRNLRHPILLWQAAEAAKMATPGVGSANRSSKSEAMKVAKQSVVPASYRLSDTVRCAVITGPNTGGKTVALKNLGAAVLMAKSGLFVLADADASGTTTASSTRSSVELSELRPTLPFFDCVLADIGDDQSIVQSLSTFSGHVQRMKRVLKRATPQSLVLLDEVGSGTDPTEGSALGIAILQHLVSNVRVRLTMATTHHGELKTLKYNDPTGAFENASAEFDDEAMRPTYRLVWGIPGRSNALAIASRLGLPDAITDRAKSILQGGAGSVDVNDVIKALERQQIDQELEVTRMRTLAEELEVLKQEAETIKQQVQLQEIQFRAEKAAVIEREVAKAKREVSEIMKRVQDESNSRMAGAARQQLDKMNRDIILEYSSSSDTEGMDDGAETTDRAPRKGDFVLIPRLGETSNAVEVVEDVNQKGELMVLVGGSMRTKVKAKDCVLKERAATATRRLKRERREQKGRTNASSTRSSNATTSSSPVMMQTSANTVDVRGQTVDEAIGEIDACLGRAMQMGSLYIIHGHGTGKLRAGIHQYLKRMQSSVVNTFEYADQVQGGTGCTIVTLK